MPEPAKFVIPVPSEDPKKKKPEEKPQEDVNGAASKKKDEEKEGEDLVCVCTILSPMLSHMPCY